MAYLRILALILCFTSMAQAQSERKFALRTNAVYDLSNSFEGGLDFRVGRSVTLGPDVITYYNKSGDTPAIISNATSYGLRLNYYTKGDAIGNSLILALAGYFVNINSSQGSTTGSVSGGMGIAGIGYEWVFRPGFMMGLLGGVIYYSVNKNLTLGSNSQANVPYAQSAQFYPEFNLGWAF